MTDEELYNEASVLAQAAERAMIGSGEEREKIEQAKVMFEALGIYAEREETRGGAWKKYGVEDSAQHLKSKSLRLSTALSMHSDDVRQQSDNPKHNSPRDKFSHEVVDSAMDAINYAAFAVRNWREARVGGHIGLD